VTDPNAGSALPTRRRGAVGRRRYERLAPLSLALGIRDAQSALPLPGPLGRANEAVVRPCRRMQVRADEGKPDDRASVRSEAMRTIWGQ